MSLEMLNSWDEFDQYGHKACRVVEYRNVVKTMGCDLEYPQRGNHYKLEDLDYYFNLCLDLYLQIMCHLNTCPFAIHQANENAIAIFKSIVVGRTYDPKWGWGERRGWMPKVENNEIEIDQTIH